MSSLVMRQYRVAIPGSYCGIRDVLLQIAVRYSSTSGPTSIPHLRAKINALMNRKEFDLIFANVIQQLILFFPGPKGINHRPFPLAFALDKIYDFDSVPIPFNRADEADPFASKGRLRQYRKEVNKDARAKIALLAMGSMDKALEAATKGLWKEALYRLQGAWLRLWARHMGSTIETGWNICWTRQPGVKYWVARPLLQHTDRELDRFYKRLKELVDNNKCVRCGGGHRGSCGKSILAGRSTHITRTRAHIIYHDSYEGRDSWLHEMFEIWYHVALVSLHIIDDPTQPKDKAFLEKQIDRAHWAVENAADQLSKYPSNWRVRKIQLDYARGWLFRCLAETKDAIDLRPVGAWKCYKDLNIAFYDAAARHAREVLGEHHRWTLECKYQVAWTDAVSLGDAKRASIMLEAIYNYIRFERPRFEKQYHRHCALWAWCMARTGDWDYVSPTTYTFLAGIFKTRYPDVGLGGRQDWDILRPKVADRLITYQYLDTLDMVDYVYMRSIVKPWDWIDLPLGGGGDRGERSLALALALLKR